MLTLRFCQGRRYVSCCERYGAEMESRLALLPRRLLSPLFIKTLFSEVQLEACKRRFSQTIDNDVVQFGDRTSLERTLE